MKPQSLRRIPLIITMLLMFSFSGMAQKGSSVSYNRATDSINGTTPLVKTIEVNDDKATTVKVQVVVTKVSGTVGGTVVLYESVNGMDYTSTGDTLTLANQATNKATWTKTNTPYPFLQVIGTNSSGAKATLRVWYSVKH